VGAGVAEIVSKALPDVQINAVIAQGSVGNPRLVHTKEAEFGMTNYFSGMNAIQGNKPFPGKMAVAGICKLQYSIIHLTTFASRNDINTVADLKGKKIAVGPPGGGGVLLFREILPFWGVKFEDITPSYVSYGDGSEALKDRKVDMNIPHGAPPLEAVSNLTIQNEIKLISMEKDKLQAINKKFPYYEEAVIPAGTYKGFNRDAISAGIQDILVVNASLGEDQVYRVTKAIYDNLAALRKIHPSVKDLKFDNYRNSLVPLHPGALKFYKEKGIPLL
ncbi:MAG: TAXI family TRAP transporter solute-binding subunit, partial [Thermodesulfobacteriota bacterium]